MNFLQLVQRLRVECGASGTGPVTTLNQKGELLRLVGWVQDAWNEIQCKHQDWEWLRRSCSFPTVLAQATYTPAQCGLSDFGMWDRDTFRCYNTLAGLNSEIFMPYLDYELWRNNFQYSALRTSYSQPNQFAITPNKSIALGPVPLAGYTVEGDYFQAPTVLTLDTDIPAMPEQHHMAIVWRALQDYGTYEELPGVEARGIKRFKSIMARLEFDRLPEMQMPGALA